MSRENLNRRLRTKVRSDLQHGFEDLDVAVDGPPETRNRYERHLREKRVGKVLRIKEKARKPHLRGERHKKWELDV